MTNPTPYLSSLKKAADDFTNTLTWLALSSGTVYGGLLGLHLFFGWDTPPEWLHKAALFFTVFWYVFMAIAILIDYAIFTAWAAFAEVASMFLSQFTYSTETSNGLDDTPKLDHTVAYLRDFLDRNRKASDPVQPSPPAA